MNWREVLAPYTDHIDTVVKELENANLIQAKAVQNFDNELWEDAANEFSSKTKKALIEWKTSEMRIQRDSFDAVTIVPSHIFKNNAQLPTLCGRLDLTMSINNSLLKDVQIDDVFVSQYESIKRAFKTTSVVLFAGVSGAGKSTFANYMASRQWTIYIELHSNIYTREAHGDGWSSLLSLVRVNDVSMDTAIYSDIYGRLVALRQLFKAGYVKTPTDWLLAQFQDYKTFIKSTAEKYVRKDITVTQLNDFTTSLCQELGIDQFYFTLDEAQMISQDRMFTTALEDHKWTLLQLFVNCIVNTQFKTTVLGTYIRLNYGQDLVSPVGKPKSVDQLVLFIGFPFIERPVEVLERVVNIPDDSDGALFRQRVNDTLYGRCRSISGLVYDLYHSYDESKPSSQLLDILARYLLHLQEDVQGYLRLLPIDLRQQDHWKTLLRGVFADGSYQISEGDAFSYGIIPFQAHEECIPVTSLDKMNIKLVEKIEYIIPNAIVTLGGNNVFGLLFGMVASGHVGHKGNALDYLVGLRMRQWSGRLLRDWLASFLLPCSLPTWINEQRIICDGIVNGTIYEYMDSTAFVLPEQSSGADGFLKVENVLITFANTRYSTKVPTRKIEDQLKKVQLKHQYDSYMLGTAKRRATDIAMASRDYYLIEILLELPSRVGDQPPILTTNGFTMRIVIDQRTVGSFMDMDTADWLLVG